MWQLVLANIDVLLATTGQELKIDPKVVRFRFRADNPMASVILANSITLTPGTVTMNVTDDGVYEIHALTVGAAAGVLDGGMQKKVADLYGEKFDFAVVESEDTILLLVLFGYIDKRPDMYVDIAISYAILGFIGSLIVAKFIGGKRI